MKNNTIIFCENCFSLGKSCCESSKMRMDIADSLSHLIMRQIEIINKLKSKVLDK